MSSLGMLQCVPFTDTLVPTSEETVLAATNGFVASANLPAGYDPVLGAQLNLAGQYPVKTTWSTTKTLPALDARYWFIQFPRPNIGSVVHGADDNTLNISLAWGDLDQTFSFCFNADDATNHPLAAYEPQTFQGLTWTFSLAIDSTIIPFDQNYGLTLTLNTTAGQFIVRMWNYITAGSTDTNATFVVNFNNLQGGWTPTGPVIDPTTIQQIFFTFTNVQYGNAVKLPAFENSALVFKQLGYTGPALTANIPGISAHGLQMTAGYDDLYDLTPKVIVDQIVALGYSEFCTLYIGESHFMTLGWNTARAAFVYSLSTDPICAPTIAWFTDFYTRLKAAGIQLIWSVSYEMLYEYLPLGWSQQDYQGNLALTGYTPPSALMAFTRADVMQHLKNTVAQCFSVQPSGDTHYLQIGEPWWWDGSYDANAPCFYDPTTVALFASENPGKTMAIFESNTAPVNTAEELFTANWLQAQLGISTQVLATYAKTLYAHVKTGVLFYTPQAFAAQLMTIVNYPVPYWKSPNLDYFQIECYGEVTAGQIALQNTQIATVMAQLGYGQNYQYFGGFVNLATDAAVQWPLIYQAIAAAKQLGINNNAIWSYSQITRDGILVYSPWQLAAAGYETPNGEHINEAVQMLKLQAQMQLGLAENDIAYYFYYNSTANIFQIIAGPAGLNTLDQIQPKRIMLQLLLDAQGLIIGNEECYVTEFAFPPASPFSRSPISPVVV
jgi:hypothetical protein